MIKSSDLRLDNLVYAPNPKGDVVVARVEKIMRTEVVLSHDGEEFDAGLDQVAGIPLGPDVLDKCGFKDVTAEGSYDFPTFEHELGDRISFDGGIYKFWLGGIYTDWTEIRSVHRLQNFFFEYTDRELKIQL